MNTNEMTISQLIELANSIGASSNNTTTPTPELPFKIGQMWLFRTVTHTNTGRIVAIHGDFVTLEDAAWIADTGRFHDSLTNTDNMNEVEPYPSQCVVNVLSIVDATQILKLPTTQK